MRGRAARPVVLAPAPVRPRLSLGVVGHRDNNPAFTANATAIAEALSGVIDGIAAVAEPISRDVRLHCLLASGVDQLAAAAALARGWELVAPLPFGRVLNRAINARPRTADEARALLRLEQVEAADVAARADAIGALYERARLFELCDEDEEVASLFLAMLGALADPSAAQGFAAACSERVALAGRVMIEQSDLIVAVWDAASHNLGGGTGHTIAAALETGAPVVWIDARAPAKLQILRAPESMARLASAPEKEPEATLEQLVRRILVPEHVERETNGGLPQAHRGIRWPRRSNRLFHGYRRVESLFGGEPRPLRSLRQSYERPDEAPTGSGAQAIVAIRSLPGGDPALAESIRSLVIERFAWADGVSAHFSDLYRGGMTASFLFSGLAIVSGIAYLPFANTDRKWLFALAELALLTAILVVMALGRSGRWHERWFEIRRIAEYFRHGPILLALGVARPPGRWPKGIKTSWPEWHARMGLREVGLPAIATTRPYLRKALIELLDRHVVAQHAYHQAKARRLANVHRNLDRLSNVLFLLAVISVAAYLALRTASASGRLTSATVHAASPFFTFLGVLLPTFGAAIAGIRYFGDFERFAAISEVTAEKLSAVHERAAMLIHGPIGGLTYRRVSDLAHAADDIVVSEIENWQAVFGGKHMTVPI